VGKLQSYFDYFDKHYEVDNWEWYKSLKELIDIAQKIKKEISATDFSKFDNNDKKTEIEKIIKASSSNKIETVEDFLQQYLYESNNGVSTIRQQLLTHERRSEITSKINSDFDILIKIFKSNDIQEVEKAVRDLVVDNVNSVIYRFIRTLFPDKLSAPDAPNRLDQRLYAIKSKLGIPIVGGSNVEKHENLMNSIKSTDEIKKQIFFWEIYDMIENNLSLKKATVYYGAPGTGKTFAAKKVAREFIDQHRIKIGKPIYTEESNYHIKTVQFHPSYSYEDFIEGIRPTTGGKLLLSNGTFKKFCKKEGSKEIELYKDDDFLKMFKEKEYDFSQIKVSELSDNQKEILEVPDGLATGISIEEMIEPAFFIIDEINRAELSRVFGELMYSLEYRGFSGKIKTQYSYLNKDEEAESVFFWKEDEDWFFIPQNIYIIGTMNNIDRSVDSFDFALRRRFMWEEIIPDFDIVRNLFSADWKDNLAKAFENLNNEIEKDDILGKDYRIGHAYALAIKPIQDRFETAKETKEFLWNDFIKPLLEEYLRGLGNEQKAKEKLDSFENSFRN